MAEDDGDEDYEDHEDDDGDEDAAPIAGNRRQCNVRNQQGDLLLSADYAVLPRAAMIDWFVSEPTIAAKMQWWRATINTLYREGVTNHLPAEVWTQNMEQIKRKKYFDKMAARLPPGSQVPMVNPLDPSTTWILCRQR